VVGSAAGKPGRGGCRDGRGVGALPHPRLVSASCRPWARVGSDAEQTHAGEWGKRRSRRGSLEPCSRQRIREREMWSGTGQSAWRRSNEVRGVVQPRGASQAPLRIGNIHGNITRRSAQAHKKPNLSGRPADLGGNSKPCAGDGSQCSSDGCSGEPFARAPARGHGGWYRRPTPSVRPQPGLPRRFSRRI